MQFCTKLPQNLSIFIEKTGFFQDLEKLLWKVLIQLHFDYVCVHMDS